IEVRFFRNVAGNRLVPLEVGGDITAVEKDRASRLAQQACEDLDGCAFAGAVRPEQAEHLTRFNVEGDILDGDEGTITLRQPLGLQHGSLDTVGSKSDLNKRLS